MPLHVEVVTPERAVLSTEAYLVEIPGTEGDMGVLADHAPVMTTVRDGEVRIYVTATGTPQRIRIAGGFAEIDARGLTLLAEHAEMVI